MGYNEADTRAKLIDPVLRTCGWTEEYIKREETPGEIVIIGAKGTRRPGRIDYTLRLKVNDDSQPIAIALIEAKSEDHSPTYGLEQAKAYAYTDRFHVPFMYSSNGHQFVEFDATTGKTSQPRPMEQFPSPDTLRMRYEQAKGFSLNDEVAKPLLTKYSGGAEAGRRYYQDAAIRAALEKIARNEKRVLLTLATGAGKTFIAVNLLKRISDAGQMRRALFLCDRDELRTQASAAFQNIFGNDAAIVSTRDPQKNARVLIATYQTLDVDTEDATSNFLKDNYPENFFSHIIIDECHRSAWGKWSEVFTRNPDAIQIGLTATPRQLTENTTEDTPEIRNDMRITADNLKHFGEPVYEYDIAQGIEDGYLAACEIVRADVDIDATGMTLEEVLKYSPTNAITGEAVTEEELKELYQHTDYEKEILLPDRVYAMCKSFFDYLLEYYDGDPNQKTIIFCARDTHADAVAETLGNIYADWCYANDQKPKNFYAFKATAASKGTQYLADLRGSSQSHFVATTVDLLTTGVDVPRVENIAFFRYMSSPISFYQMIGRGTRIYAPGNKLMFRVYDYTNATRLFGEEFITKLRGTRTSTGEKTESDTSPPITIRGVEVHVTEAGRFVLDENGDPITLEEYREQLGEQLLKEAENLSVFRQKWIDPLDRQALLTSLPDGGRSVEVIQELQGMKGYDLYDVLAEIGYGMEAKTMRVERDLYYEGKSLKDLLAWHRRQG